MITAIAKQYFSPRYFLMDTEPQHNPLPVVAVEGDHRACGIKAGEQSRDRIIKSLATYKRMFALCDISWDEAVEKARVHLPVIKEFTPHLLEELEGVASGCSDKTDGGIDVGTLLALNCRTEILPPDFLLRAMVTSGHNPDDYDTHTNECTSLAVARNNHPVWLAQNWDWVGLQRDALIVLHAKPYNQPACITVTEAGMLAKIGINDKGFAVSLNILRSHDDGQSPGLPVHFLLRALLECSSVEEASDFARRLPFASSSNILIADKSGDMASLEISPKGCQVLSAENNQLCHTNHFLSPELVSNDAGLKGNISTVSRLATAQRNLSGIQSFEDINKLLSDTSGGNESICRFADKTLAEIAQIETVVAVAMNLTAQTLLVTAAQPAITDFTEHRFYS